MPRMVGEAEGCRVYLITPPKLEPARSPICWRRRWMRQSLPPDLIRRWRRCSCG